MQSNNFTILDPPVDLQPDLDHGMATAENVLNRDFTATAMNQKWVADITYIPTCQGWLYLAAVMDLYSRRIVGWAMSKHIDSALVVSAINMVILQRRSEAGLLHHSDRDRQYASDFLFRNYWKITRSPAA